MQRKIFIEKESWPLAQVFTISRGSKTHAEVIKLTITEGLFRGISESVPYNRYGESLDSVIEQIRNISKELEAGAERKAINQILPAGAARNAVDCALWDLECKKASFDIFALTGKKTLQNAITAQTLCIGSVQSMAKEAKQLANYPLIKVKLDADQVIEKMRAVHSNAPNSQFIIDPNEGWTFEQLQEFSPELQKFNVVLLEQPLSSEKDDALIEYDSPIPLCADESLHTRDDLTEIKKKYHFINIKLDKTGGLTEALKLLNEAKSNNLKIMVGCMVGTSLAMAPATIIAPFAEFIDLDGPALLAKDREHGFQYHYGKMSPLNTNLWGGAV